MKKVVMSALLLGTLAMTVKYTYAACMGPYCWDDKGAYVAGILQDGNGSGLPSKTLAQIQTNTPSVAGQELYCSNCVQTPVCISSGTGQGAYVAAATTTTVGGGLLVCR